MVTKKQKKIIKDIKKTSKELKETGLTSLEIILIVTSIFMVAGGLAVYALLGIYIDDLSKQINKRTNFIKRSKISFENTDKKLRTQINQNQRLLQENEKLKKFLDKIEKENLKLGGQVKELKNKHELYNNKLVTTEKEFVKKASSLTLTTNEKNKLEKNKKILEKKINVLMAKNIELERKIKNFSFFQNEYLLGYMDTHHENTRLKEKYRNLNKRTRKSIKYHQNIARERQLENKRLRKKKPWIPSGSQKYPYTRKLLNKTF